MEQTRPKKRRLLRMCIALLLLGGAGVGLGLWLFGLPSVPAHAVLVLRIGDTLPSAPPGGLEALFFGEEGPVLPELYTSLARAATDPRVDGVFLDLRDGCLGLADARELRRLLMELKKEHKPVIAYADDLSFRAWYVASACDTVVLNPAGYLRLTGTGMRVLLFGDLLKRLKLKADLERIGRYKAAFETMTDNKLSPSSRESLQRVADAVWEQLLVELADARALDRGALEEMIEQGPLAARAALDKKLVDALKWRDELDAFVKSTVGGEPRFVPFGRYRAHALRARADATIAYLPLVGTIVPGDAPSRGIIAADAVVSQLAELRDNPEIAAIVVRIDSPGGDALASARLYRALRGARSQKPVIVSMGASAASGGYYCAAGADYIVAQPFTLTGSIGIFGGKIVAADLLAWAGVTQETFRHGAFAGLYDPLEPFTPAMRAMIRRELEDLYDRFVKDVAEGRNLAPEAVESAAGGRVWTGEDARAHKLVDAVGGLDVALAKAKELARIEGGFVLQPWPPRKAWYEELVTAEKDLHGLEGAAALQRALCAGRPLAILPFGMTWE